MYQKLIHLAFMRAIAFLIIFQIFSNSIFGQPGDTTLRHGNKIVKCFTAPVVLIGLGLYTKHSGSIASRFDIKIWRDNNYPNFSNRADDVIQFLPIGLVYGIDALNVKAKNDFINRTLILIKTEILVNGLVQFLKHTTDIKRPNGTGEHSFPSGHTAQAFAAATFMHRELGHHSIWISIGAYTMATSVGVFRVLNDKHWSSDVLTGAGIGILSTNLAYLTHQYKWGKRPDLVLMPTYSNGPGLFVSFKLN